MGSLDAEFFRTCLKPHGKAVVSAAHSGSLHGLIVRGLVYFRAGSYVMAGNWVERGSNSRCSLYLLAGGGLSVWVPFLAAFNSKLDALRKFYLKGIKNYGNKKRGGGG